MCSYHAVILTTLKSIAIKFKVTEKIVVQINCKLIGYHNMTNDLFNNSISMSIAGRSIYSNYNKHILEAGTNTVTINNQKKKGWFHFI